MCILKISFEYKLSTRRVYMTNCMQVHYIKYCNVQTIIINVNCKITLRVFLYLGTVDYAELSFWIILLDKAEIRDSILKLDYS